MARPKHEYEATPSWLCVTKLNVRKSASDKIILTELATTSHGLPLQYVIMEGVRLLHRCIDSRLQFLRNGAVEDFHYLEFIESTRQALEQEQTDNRKNGAHSENHSGRKDETLKLSITQFDRMDIKELKWHLRLREKSDVIRYALRILQVIRLRMKDGWELQFTTPTFSHLVGVDKVIWERIERHKSLMWWDKVGPTIGNIRRLVDRHANPDEVAASVKREQARVSRPTTGDQKAFWEFIYSDASTVNSIPSLFYPILIHSTASLIYPRILSVEKNDQTRFNSISFLKLHSAINWGHAGANGSVCPVLRKPDCPPLPDPDSQSGHYRWQVLCACGAQFDRALFQSRPASS